jgi:hypothetical protein
MWDSYLYLIQTSLILQEKELQLPIHRSRSVPAFIDDDTPVGGMFRIFRTIPQFNEKITTTISAASPTGENGNIIGYIFLFGTYYRLTIVLNHKS